MPQKAPGPTILIHHQEIMEFRMFTDLNQRRKRTIPEEKTITISTTTKPARHSLTLHSSQQKAIPNSTSKDTPDHSLISLPNMVRVQELQGTLTSSQGLPRKPFLTHRSAATLPLHASSTAARKCSIGPAKLLSTGNPGRSHPS